MNFRSPEVVREEFDRLSACPAEWDWNAYYHPWIERARASGAPANVKFDVGDVIEAQLPALGFDGIVSIAALHHMDLAAALAPPIRWLRSGRPFPTRASRAAWAQHEFHDRRATIPEIRRIAEARSAGSVVRRRLFWRYSLTWAKPG